MKQLEEIKAIVFDMDGVLFDTEKMYLDAWKILGDEVDIPNVEEVARQCIGLSITDTTALLVSTYGEDFPLNEYIGRVDKIVKDTIENKGMPIKVGVFELLDFLYENNYTVGLASSSRYEKIVKYLHENGLTKYFSIVVGGDMIANSKPDPEIYRLACEKLGVNPQNTIAIEDSKNGIVAASRAGMMTFMVPDLVEPTPEILQMVYRKFDNLIQVRDFLA